MQATAQRRANGWPGWAFAGLLALLIAILDFTAPDINWESHAADQLYITEVAATAESAILDEDGERSDWIEIANFGRDAADLTGWYLTDNYHQLAKWKFPEFKLSAGTRLVVLASGKDRRDPAARLHTNFELNEKGEYLALIRPDGRTVTQEYLPRFPQQHGRHTFGLRDRMVAARGAAGLPFDAYRYFDHGTPGLPNSQELAGLVGEIRASASSGLCQEPFTLVLFSPTAGARLLYTTDGSAPDRFHGTPYRGPLQVSSTTVVRAIAIRPGFASSPVLTRTFVFPQSVLRQDGAGFPQSWGLTNGTPIQGYYGLTPRVTAPPASREQLVQGLQDLPSLFLTTTVSNWFDPEHGVYANPQEHGSEWERPAHAEWIPASGKRGFQIACGIRVQGGWNRRPEECPKHSLRIVFKKDYGQAHLNYPLFGKTGAQSFDTLILRGGCNNTWLHWSGEERARGDYLRDQWMRDTLAAMGHLSARGSFAHVYLNGLYWGLYNVAERPSGAFIAANEGGKPNDYDSLSSGHALNGDTNAWHELFTLANAGLTNDLAYQSVAQRVDLPAFADYMLLNFYGANGDWDRASNWYSGRRRNPAGPFRFYVWDGERTLEKFDDNRADADDDLCPTGLFHKLEAVPAFRRLFAERARLHCQDGGALSPAVAAARYQALARQIERAIYAESARWGSYRFDVHQYKTGPYEPYTVEKHWRPEINRLLSDYFPRRTAAYLNQLRQRGLWSGDPRP